MKKKNIGLMVIAVLLLVVTVSLSTFAIYKSTSTGNAKVEVAKWVVKVDGNNMVTTDTFTLADVEWATNTDVKEGKIAPGSTGTLELEIDASESEVSVDYAVELDTTAIDNDNITISVDEEEGTIDYSATAADMKKTVTINVEWDALDTDAANTADLEMAGQSIEIPVTITATQHVE